MMRALPMSKSATLLVSKMTTISLRLTGRLRSEISILRSARPTPRVFASKRSTWSMLDFSDSEQFRADRQIGRFDGIEVNTHSDFVFFGGESDHTTAGRKVIRITYGEDASAS